MSTADRVGDPFGQAIVLYDQARPGRPGDVVARLAALTDGWEGDLMPVCVNHATALLHHDAPALESVVARFEALGAELLAAETRVRLTQSERDVALLAVAGRTNKEIAAELFLSPRTVENSLHRAYEKLGVAGRAELAAALDG